MREQVGGASKKLLISPEIAWRGHAINIHSVQRLLNKYVIGVGNVTACCAAATESRG